MENNLEFYKKLILDHNKNPRNYGSIDKVTHSSEGYNPLCGDKVVLFIDLVGDVVIEVGFEAQACALCKASASMMSEIIKTKKLEEISVLKDNFERLLDGESTDAVGELAVFQSVSSYPARVKCVKLPWNTLQKALGKSEEATSHE